MKIAYKGALSPGQSVEAFQKHDVFLFPTLSENYGHVIVEAITSGCSVVLSKGTTPWDDINKNGGFIVPLNEERKWSQIIDDISGMTVETFDRVIESLRCYVLNKLSIEEVKTEYEKMFTDGA